MAGIQTYDLAFSKQFPLHKLELEKVPICFIGESRPNPRRPTVRAREIASIVQRREEKAILPRVCVCSRIHHVTSRVLSPMHHWAPPLAAKEKRGGPCDQHPIPPRLRNHHWEEGKAIMYEIPFCISLRARARYR